MPKLRHIAIAAEDPVAMAEFYKKAFDFKEVGRPNGVLADGVFLSDGTLNMAIACEDPVAMAEFYNKAFDFKEVRRSDGALAYGEYLTDGTINLAILRFKTDQIGKGMDYTGLHHFGILVEDVEAASKKVEAL